MLRLSAIILIFLAAAAQDGRAASSIDPILPQDGLPYAASIVRGQFDRAINDIQALQTLNAGASAPSNPITGTPWLSTPQSSAVYALYIYDGASWGTPVGSFDAVNHIFMPPIGGGMLPSLLSATTTNLGSVPEAALYVTGSNNIQSFGSSAPAGTMKVIIFTGAPTLTNSSSLILPTGANITQIPGGVEIALALGSGNWKVLYDTNVLLAGGIASVPTNAALMATPTTAYSQVIRTGFAASGDSPAVLYTSSGSPCSLNSGDGDGGSQVRSSDGKCWNAAFPATGIDARVFGLSSSGDAGPPLRAAIAAAIRLGLPLVTPGGTFNIQSTDPLGNPSDSNGPYPATLPPGLLVGLASHGAVTGFTWYGYGTVLQMSGSGCTQLPTGYGNDCRRTEPVFVDHVVNPVILGLTFNGYNLGASGPSSEIAALDVFNAVGGRFADITCTNFGGVGTCMDGDWDVGTVFDHFVAFGIGAFCADLAFQNSVIISNWLCTGATTTGDGFSFQYDVPNAAQNLTGHSFTDNTDISLVQNDISGFNAGAFLSSGSGYTLRGNYWHGNTATTGGAAPVGVYLHSNDQIASGGQHPSDVSISDSFSGNGDATAGGGDFAEVWNGSIATGSIDRVALTGSTFANRVTGNALQVSVASTHHSYLTINANSGLMNNGFSVAQLSPQTDLIVNNTNLYSGIAVPALPGATGSGNAVTNANPWPVRVRAWGSSAFNVCVVPRGGSAFCDGVNVPVNGVSEVFLNPSDAIYFNTALPSGWYWAALGG